MKVMHKTTLPRSHVTISHDNNRIGFVVTSTIFRISAQGGVGVELNGGDRAYLYKEHMGTSIKP